MGYDISNTPSQDGHEVYGGLTSK